MEVADSFLVKGGIGTLQLALLISKEFIWVVRFSGDSLTTIIMAEKGDKGSQWTVLLPWSQSRSSIDLCRLRYLVSSPSPSWGSWHELQVWAEDDENAGGVYHLEAGLGAVSLNIDSTSVLQVVLGSHGRSRVKVVLSKWLLCSRLQPPCHLGVCSILWGFTLPWVHKE